MHENGKKSYEYKSAYGDVYTVEPKLAMYVDNDNLYVGLDFYDEEYNCWDSFCDVTVNINKQPYLCSAIDTNNNGNAIVDFLEKNGIAEYTGMVNFSGYCAYPVFYFNEEKLKEINPEVFAEYAKAHGKNKEPLDKKLKDAESRAKADTYEDKGIEVER